MNADEDSSLIYLDYNATTPLDKEVVNGIQQSLVSDWGNPSSLHPYGVQAKACIDKARKQISEMINCSPSNIIFTSGGTEANNMVIRSAVKYYHELRLLGSLNKIGEKPHIITTNVEHDSVILPIQHLKDQSVVTCSIIKANSLGCIKVEDVISKIDNNTCLISVMAANNETGVIMPIAVLGERIAEINNERRRKQLGEILFHTDGAQIIGKELVDFQALHLDYLTIVGHKFYGPKIGCIAAKGPLYPIIFGGAQEGGVRPGTENTPMIVGLGIAAALVKQNLKTYQHNMLECRERLESRLQEVFGSDVVINCKNSLRLVNTTSISFKGTDMEGALVLSRCKLLIAGVGAACHGGQFSQVLVNSGVPPNLARNAIRLSVGRYTTLEDIEAVVLDLLSAVNQLKSTSSITIIS